MVLKRRCAFDLYKISLPSWPSLDLTVTKQNMLPGKVLPRTVCHQEQC